MLWHPTFLSLYKQWDLHDWFELVKKDRKFGLTKKFKKSQARTILKEVVPVLILTTALSLVAAFYLIKVTRSCFCYKNKSETGHYKEH